MDFIQGQSLDTVWNDLEPEQKRDISRQLRDILTAMRSLEPPPRMIGACDGTKFRDRHIYHDYDNPICHDEKSFNDFLLASLNVKTPPALRDALAARLRTNHRIVLSHCDLAPRNIMVQDGKIVALLDWEDAGWYPEYWEYVKFFQRNYMGNDWMAYAADIFPQLYQDELVDYIALLGWQYH